MTLLALVGCHAFEPGQDPYYTGTAPTISSIEPAVETGNYGGAEVTINGSGFGTDPDHVVVQFGNHSAEILTIEDGRMTVRTPRGPTTGGPINVVIADDGGYTELAGGYAYDVTLDDETTTIPEENAYILIQNMWTSCYGGMWTNPDIGGCETIAYSGSTGIAGSSEWFDASYPRIHTGSIGFVGSNDSSLDTWSFEGNYDLSFPSADDLRRHISDFELRNPLFEGDSVYVDPTRDPADNEVGSSDPNAVRYDKGVLEYCEGDDPDSGPDFLYLPDWPVKHSFFQSDAEDPNAQFSPVAIDIEIPVSTTQNAMAGTLLFPPQVQVFGTEGFAEGSAEVQSYWALAGLDACPDGDGDGSTEIDEDAFTLSWIPIDETFDGELEDTIEGLEVLDVHTYVQVEVSFLPIGWFGLTTGAPRATIVVPDDNAFDEGTGMSSVSVPNDIMLRFPTPNFEWSVVNDFSNTGTLGNWDSNASYMIVELFRITDYEIATENGPLVISYATGDMAFPIPWTNPHDLSGDGCGDCIDNDGDGWADAQDPDCNEDVGGNGAVEDGSNAGFTCNDGIDNNDDGLIDREDTDLCQNGWDGESTCANGVDDDGDGWEDAEDPDCQGGDQEDGSIVTECSDGLDSDLDGWIDRDDPGCDDGADDDEGGFGTTACNDGVDNDGHLDIDANDPYCQTEGALTDEEAPAAFASQCADGEDNDGDDYLDGFDPDCELPPRTREYQDNLDEGDLPHIPACYDGEDNDGDGFEDAEDPSCWSGTANFRPDGFLDDETASNGGGCTDGLDGDGDTWIDGQDPDCQPGDASTQIEVGGGTSECNNGIDDDGDGDIDSADGDCRSATDTSE